MDGQRCIWHNEPKKNLRALRTHPMKYWFINSYWVTPKWYRNKIYSILTLFHSMWFCYLYVA